MLAVDDVQWLDRSSRNVVSFALRRLIDEPVRLIVTCRTGALADAVEHVDLGVVGQRIDVGPLSTGVLQRIVTAQLGQSFFARHSPGRIRPRAGIRWSVRRWRALCSGVAASREWVSRFPVPADLRVLVTERLRGLSEQARHLLLVSAALAQPTVAAVIAACDDPETSARALTEAAGAGLLEFDGERIHFAHPLIASIPYADLAPADRRRLHQQLAVSVSDAEEHARHAPWVRWSVPRSSPMPSTSPPSGRAIAAASRPRPN